VTASALLVQLLNGLAGASSLFLVSAGLSLIFGVTRIVNFAHGSFYMLAAYFTYSLTAALPLGPGSFYVAAVLAALIVAAIGGCVEVLLLRRVYRAPELYQLLLTFALVLVVADAVRYFWGADNKTGPAAPGLAGSVHIAGQLFPSYDLAVIVFGPLVALGLWLLSHRTRWGVLIRAATQDREMVAALGVDQRHLFTGVFVLGSFLAGLGGALQVPRLALTTVMDTTVIVEAFVVVVIGGMGSVWGALLASLLIGVLNAYGVLVLVFTGFGLYSKPYLFRLLLKPHGSPWRRTKRSGEPSSLLANAKPSGEPSSICEPSGETVAALTSPPSGFHGKPGRSFFVVTLQTRTIPSLPSAQARLPSAESDIDFSGPPASGGSIRPAFRPPRLRQAGSSSWRNCWSRCESSD
jgi:branched-chain amino acid transport system permease protein